MFPYIYYEKEIAGHPTTQALLKRFSRSQGIEIERYGEVFNRNGQNFRIQKSAPSLILAKKHKNYLLPTPPGYGIGRRENYYFSHLLNCPFDCRYCFLQGMYRSAHFVFFVNFEDFQQAIKTKLEEKGGGEMTIFTGYDCDSLAFESVTGFAHSFIPFFAGYPEASFELRTKSTQITALLKEKALNNCVVAYTLTPEVIGKLYEHKAPSLEKRLEAMMLLQERGWNLGIRFDPLIFLPNFKEIYSEFFKEVFLKIFRIQSVTLGMFRLPREFHKKMTALYPKEKLFVLGVEEKANNCSYYPEIEEEILAFCQEEILKYIPKEKLMVQI